jgi:transposase-like protein
VTHHTPASFTMQGFGAATQHALLAEKEQKIRAMSVELTTRMLQQSVEAEIAEVMGQHYAERVAGVSTWQCRRCGTRDRAQFVRNGHYRRALTVREGTVTLRMPLVRCRCKGYVQIPWQTIDPRARYWLDVNLDGVRRYLAGEPYRLVGDAASTQAQTNISHVQSWRTMQDAGEEAGKVAAGVNVSPCPRSVILDEAYISVDGAKMVFLIAVSDEGEVLAVWGPARRTLEDWQGLVEWLTERGISPLRGLVGVTYDGDSAIRGAVQLVWPRVVLQQCVWHIMQRVAQDASSVHGAHAPEVERIVEQAARVFLHDDAGPEAETRARLQLTQFVLEHCGTAWAQTVSRAFDEGTEYLRTPGLQRTNGEAERAIKQLRRRTKTMDGFKSAGGAAHFAVLWRPWTNLRSKLRKEHDRLRRHRRRNQPNCHAHPKLA